MRKSMLMPSISRVALKPLFVKRLRSVRLLFEKTYPDVMFEFLVAPLALGTFRSFGL